MLRFHEGPISIFKEIQSLTDGDYALVHLLEENEEYAKNFLKASEEGRIVYLDNSVYELGHPEPELMKKWGEKLKPYAYFVPDYLYDKEKTIQSFKEFPKLPGKRIGVVQGKDLEEVISCYQFMSENADMIAISCDVLGNGYYVDNLYETDCDCEEVKRIRDGRKILFLELEKRGLLNWNKPHHLLGCVLPQDVYEMKYLPFVFSVDTSNPIFQPLLNNFYDDKGELRKKMSQRRLLKEGQKLFELPVSDFQLKEIKSAIEIFRHYTDYKWNQDEESYELEKEIHQLIYEAYAKGLKKYGDNPITPESAQLKYDNLTSLQHIDAHLIEWVTNGEREGLSHFFFRLLNSRHEVEEGISLHQLQNLYKKEDARILYTLKEFRKNNYLRNIIDPKRIKQIDKEKHE